mmetsp:Transcript_87321/g.271290  ORF Transcript_87321/g.271290 Transcript_87321/m.271290 type:complete len:272 (+) Transcript_87321:621-1436(+)
MAALSQRADACAVASTVAVEERRGHVAVCDGSRGATGNVAVDEVSTGLSQRAELPKDVLAARDHLCRVVRCDVCGEELCRAGLLDARPHGLHDLGDALVIVLVLIEVACVPERIAGLAARRGLPRARVHARDCWQALGVAAEMHDLLVGSPWRAVHPLAWGPLGGRALRGAAPAAAAARFELPRNSQRKASNLAAVAWRTMAKAASMRASLRQVALPMTPRPLATSAAAARPAAGTPEASETRLRHAECRPASRPTVASIAAKPVRATVAS